MTARSEGWAIMNSRGFTLVELLVVIAIIAILLMLMAPTAGRMMVLVDKDVCYSNVHHLSIAWATYQAENNGCLVNGSTHGANPWAKWGDETESNSSRYTLITTGALFPYTHETRFYLCPSDPYKHIRSYSIASMMNGCDWSPEDIVNNHPDLLIPYANRYVQVLAPSEQMVFCDEKDSRSSSNMGTFAQDRLDWNYNRWVDYVANFHERGDNFGFADGHAEYWKWVDDRTIDASTKRQFFYPDPAANRNQDLWRIRRSAFAGIAGAY